MKNRTVKTYLLLVAMTRLSLSFFFGTYAVFLQSRGLDLFEISMVNFSYFACMLIFEIPTGALADVFGRKMSFVISCFLYSAGGFIYALSDSFWGFVLAEGISAIGSTFASGAFQAWLVDELRHSGEQVELTDVFSKEQQLAAGVPIFGAILGAWIGTYSLAAPWILMGVGMLATATLASVVIREDGFRGESCSLRHGLGLMRRAIRTGAVFGFKSPTVRFIFIVGTTQFFAVMAPNMQWQGYFANMLGGVGGLGFVYAIISMTVLLGSRLGPRVLSLVGSERIALNLSQLVVGVGLAFSGVFLSFPIPAVMFFVLHEVGRGMFKPLKDAYLNDNIPSNERATILSIESMSHHLGGMTGLFLTGLIANSFSISAAWIVSGLVLTLSSLWLMLLRPGEQATICTAASPAD